MMFVKYLKWWWVVVVLLLAMWFSYKYRPDVVIAYEWYDITGTGKDTLQYQLISPAHQQSANKYPMVIYLHGANSRGTDNQKQMRMLQPFLLDSAIRLQYPCYVLAPQCKPHPYGWSGMRGTSSLLSSPLVEVEHIVERLVGLYAIDTNRIYVVGYSMGGAGAWETLAAHPRRYAAVVTMCSWADTSTASAISHIPVWAFHGAKDGVVPVQGIRAMIRALKSVGAPVRYTEYPEGTHGCWRDALRDPQLLPWLFAQHK